jgi:adenylate kinase family enzyme
MRRRLVIYFNQTVQLLDYYSQQHKLRVVDGNQTIDQVQATFLSVINDYAGRETTVLSGSGAAHS